MSRIIAGLDHHDVDAGPPHHGQPMIDQAFSNPASLLLWIYGNDVDLTHPIIWMDPDAHPSGDYT